VVGVQVARAQRAHDPREPEHEARIDRTQRGRDDMEACASFVDELPRAGMRLKDEVALQARVSAASRKLDQQALQAPELL
jgi:hypothetical protein